jgi:parallel beta-helix repeat protein
LAEQPVVFNLLKFQISLARIYANYDGISVWQSDNCTIQGSEIDTNQFDGISITESANSTITQNTIHDNYEVNNSDGIIVQACSPEISRNTIYDNRFNISLQAYGSEVTSPIIKNNLIYQLTSGEVDFGILMGGNDTSTVSPVIYHNTIDGGTYEGILIERYNTSTVSPEIKYNIVTNFNQYGIQNVGGNPTIDYNDVWNNGASAADNYKDCTAGSHDISQDPQYGSYTLLVTSPCINAISLTSGDPISIDLNGDPRPYGAGFDMGCYEMDNLPAVSTADTSSITTNAATSGGTVTSSGGESSVTTRGVCWSTSVNPTISLPTKTDNGPGTGTFTSILTGLSPNTTYHVRAYATNALEVTGYGSDKAFTTNAVIAPTVATTAISSITGNSAASGGNVSSDGGATVTARGVCWSTSANPTVSLPTKTTDGSGTGSFASSITGLSPNTTYHVRAYATNSDNLTGYGNDLSFTTASGAPGITSFSPTFGGTGTSVVITGSNFTGATSVKFGAAEASSFTVDSQTLITAFVGGGATGKISVTTPGGTSTSTDTFTFVPPGNYYVNAVTGDDANDGSLAHPWKTLHHAIAFINSGGPGIYVLYVAQGTYGIAENRVTSGEADTVLTLTQSNVTLLGEGETPPVIDGANTQNWTKGVIITGSNAVIKNLRFTGFSSTFGEGMRISGTGNEVKGCAMDNNTWGIRVDEAVDAQISGCQISQNLTHGIDVTWSNGTVISNNKVFTNTGFGIRAESSPEISRNLIYDNTYGIIVEAINADTASPSIKNNVIYEVTPNAMSYGIFSRATNESVADPILYHNTIDGGVLSGVYAEKDNTSSSSPVIKYNIITNFNQYGIQNNGTNPTIDYNDVWNNTAGNYGGCQGGANDISQDPLYGSYQLQSTSPCIDKIGLNQGDPVTLDYPGYRRPKGAGFDMGAYEYVGSQSDDYPLPGGTGQVTDYRIFTVPFSMTGAEMLTEMETKLGTYNPGLWRVFAYLGSTYMEINTTDFAAHDIIPGMGFWIITTLTDTIPFWGTIAPDGVDYKLSLPSGWSLMALPWTGTDIDLGNIQVTDGLNSYSITSADNNFTQRCVWHYTGVGPYNGYEKLDLSTDTLNCGTGYFFKVLSANNVTVLFPPTNTVRSGVKAERGSTGDEEEPPPPPGGTAQVFSCPDITNGRLENIAFPSYANCRYTYQGTLTIGSGVTVSSRANITIRATKVIVETPFHAEGGAVINIVQP